MTQCSRDMVPLKRVCLEIFDFYIYILYIYLYISVYQYIYIYIYIYKYIYTVYIHISINIYLKKKIEGLACFLFKRTQHSAFFCIRTLRFLRSFTFFAKECCVLCILLRSLQKNVTQRTQKNASFFWVS